MAKCFWGALPFLVILLIWRAAAADSAVIPSIRAVGEVFRHPFREPVSLDAIPLAQSALISFLRVLFGFSIAALTAVPAGLLIGRCSWIRSIGSPIMASAMVISPVAWIPIAILIFGLASPATALYGDDAWRHGWLDQMRFAIIGVIWMGAFFPILLNVAAGAGQVRDAYIEAARVLGATRVQILRKVILPSAAPSIITGLRVGGSIAWRVIIAAEMFPGTRGGLGYMITTSHVQASYEYGFASIIVIGLIGLGLDGALRLLSIPFGYWQTKERS